MIYAAVLVVGMQAVIVMRISLVTPGSSCSEVLVPNINGSSLAEAKRVGVVATFKRNFAFKNRGLHSHF